MALFKILKGESQNLPSELHEGYAYFLTDTGEFYVDISDSERRQLSAEKLSRTRSGETEVIEIDDLLLMKDKIQDVITVSDGGAMTMGETLGAGPYNIQITEDEDEGGETILTAEDITYNNSSSGLTATNVQAAINELNSGKATIDYVNSQNQNFVPNTRTINGHPLTENININASDTGSVPTTRTINGKKLSNNISLVAADVGAAETEHNHDVSDMTSGILSAARGGTGNANGKAASATKLATARTIQTNLASTAAASFNGTANITPGITGVLSMAHGGTGVSNMVGTDYTTNRPRGIILQTSTPSSVSNGCLVGVYE